MSESLIVLKRRISTIKSTSKITRAMDLVSSVKYQKWKKVYDDTLIYFKSMKDTMDILLSNLDISKYGFSYYYTGYEANNSIYVIVTSSLGLCGAYNYNIFKTVDPLLKEGDLLVVLGSKGLIHYKNSGFDIDDKYANIMEQISYSDVKSLRHYLFRLYREKKYKKISLCYTKYVNSLSFVPVIYDIAPLNLDLFEKKKNYSYPPLFVPDCKTCADELFPHYADSSIYKMLIESQLSEQASRRNAMQSATDNAEDILDNLKIVYNKTRQGKITQEITEVVAGSLASERS